jgi:hypothetical protein
MNAIATPGTLNAPALRRVRRADAHSTAFTKPDGLELCLECWKDWMAGDPDRDLGVKTMRGLVGGAEEGEEGTAARQDVYEAQQAADYRIGAATDAMINSLSRIHIWAIYRSCSIASVWRFPNADLLAVAAEAKEQLTEKLKRNVCTATLF